MCTNRITIGTELNCMHATMYGIETIHATLCIRAISKEYITLTAVFLYRLTLAQT